MDAVRGVCCLSTEMTIQDVCDEEIQDEDMGDEVDGDRPQRPDY
jgi:hypothetical protein